MLDSTVVPQWIASVLRDIAESEVAELALVIRNDAPPPPRRTLRERIESRRRWFLYEWYTRRDDRRRGNTDDPFQPVDVAPLLAGCPVIGIVPHMTQHRDAFPDADVDRILAHRLDVALRFGFRILHGRSLGVARYGVWSYHHGDNERYRGGPAGFWEVYDDSPVTGTVLQQLSEALDAGRILYRTYSSTNRYSVRANRNGFYWKPAAFVLRKLRDVHHRGEAGLESHTAPIVGWQGYGERLYVRPSNREMLGFLWRISSRRLASHLSERLGRPQWVLGYQFERSKMRHEDGDSGSAIPAGTMYRSRRLLPPSDHFWADPFPLRVDGRYYVFFEDFPYATGKGVIAMLELGPEGPVGEAVTVLERPYHLSYPFVFRWRGAVYMIPESSANRQVELYRATEFPLRWELERVLVSGLPIQDATLVEHEGRWWMFACVTARGDAPSDELHLYSAPSPLGPWAPHASNPVKSDVRSARPAGRLFRVNGELFRPAQDCALRYGHAIRVHRVEQLDDDGYRECEVSFIPPEWAADQLATHTINSDGGLTLIDVQRRQSLLARWRYRAPARPPSAAHRPTASLPSSQAPSPR